MKFVGTLHNPAAPGSAVAFGVQTMKAIGSYVKQLEEDTIAYKPGDSVILTVETLKKFDAETIPLTAQAFNNNLLFYEIPSRASLAGERQAQ